MNSIKRIMAALLVGGAGFGLFVACGTEPSDCTLDGDCAEGQACEAQVCVDVCEADTDCGAGQVCEAGVNTASKVCKDDGQTGTNNSDTNNNTTNTNSNNVEPTLYYVAAIQDTSSGDACAESDPGSDIFGVALESTTGEILGYGSVAWEEFGPEDNQYQNTGIIDGSAPDLAADDCPSDFNADTVVALGCGGWLAVEFFDATDGTTPVALDATAGQQIRVYEYGGQCGTGTVVDSYDIRICTDTMGIKAGNDSSCTIDAVLDASGEGVGEVSGF